MPNPDRRANIVLNERERIFPALRGVKRTLALSLVNLVAGVLVCGGVMWLSRSSQPQEAPRPLSGEPSFVDAGAESHGTKSIDHVTMADSLPQGDDLLKSGDILGASRAYDRLLGQTPNPSEILRYRQALCLELLGDAEHAISAYQALADSSSSAGVVSAALLGQVRMQSQGNHWRASRKLLLTMILTSGGRENTASSAFHYLAQLAAKEIFAADVPLYDDRGIAISNWKDDVAWLLELPAELGSPERYTQPADTLKILDRLGDNPATIRVAVRHNDMPLATLLDQLLRQAGLHAHWAPTARTVAESRSVNVAVLDLDLATLLDGLLEPIDLVWIAKPPNIQIATRLEVPPDYIQRRRQIQAERICHHALSVFPDHPRATRTYMSLGNIAFQRGQYQAANSYYGEILRRSRDVQIIRDTRFNLAKSLRQLNLLEEAREEFFKVVDHARGHAIEPIAYLYLGESFLEAHETDTAIKHLVRAVSLAHDPAILRLSALTLSSAYLLAGNPQAANMILMDQRDSFDAEPCRSNGLFLSSLARFRAAAIPTERLRRGRNLTSAIAEVEPSRFFSFAEPVLLGQAYSEIGMPNQMQEVYAAAIRTAKPHALRDATMLALANHYVQNDQPARGKELYEELIDHGRSPWSRKARIQTAELAHRHGDDAACLDQCYYLIETSTAPDEKREVLRLMGRVYERQADHYKAALCFAGLIPHVASTSEDEKGSER